MQIEHVYLSDWEIQNYKGQLETYSDGKIKELLKIKKIVEQNSCDINMLKFPPPNMEIYQLRVEVENLKAPVMMLMKLIEVVNSTPALQTEWERFMALIKLAADPEDLKY